ncbi:TfuA-like protein [Streptomyces sp. NBC_00986]|uniref:TfuA-like protein n=1 Tax=Streptomyces sp. NBC_00986 TaxID=2903702 RepID=UPI0038700F57|nr:TfuA domain-containing protein [Streptomyces sp. NBC_00986]
MGALHAAELAPYGMVGIGRVLRGFRDGFLDAEHEVAVLQGPDDRAFTQALVNLRFTWAVGVRVGHVGSREPGS